MKFFDKLGKLEQGIEYAPSAFLRASAPLRRQMSPTASAS